MTHTMIWLRGRVICNLAFKNETLKKHTKKPVDNPLKRSIIKTNVRYYWSVHEGIGTIFQRGTHQVGHY